METIKATTNKLVNELKDKNCRVFISHRRYYGDMLYSKMEARLLKSRGLLNNPISTHGGLTTLRIIFPDGKVREGVSVCHRNDVFCRAMGVSKAFWEAKDVPAKPLPPKKIWTKEKLEDMKTTGKRYASVEELLRNSGASEERIKEIQQIAKESGENFRAALGDSSNNF